jgi:hypothetical protein
MAKKGFGLEAAEDLTIVVTKLAPRIVIFDNASLGMIPPLGDPLAIALLAWRHAAEPLVSLKIRRWDPGFPDSPIEPDADAVWAKGDAKQQGTTFVDYIFQVRATVPNFPDTIAGPVRVLTVPSHRVEFILVGTGPGNLRFVVLDRLVSLPSP